MRLVKIWLFWLFEKVEFIEVAVLCNSAHEVLIRHTITFVLERSVLLRQEVLVTFQGLLVLPQPIAADALGRCYALFW